jgi:hypothetical protein
MEHYAWAYTYSMKLAVVDVWPVGHAAAVDVGKHTAASIFSSHWLIINRHLLLVTFRNPDNL